MSDNLSYPPNKRSAKNFLIDPRFQLKYTALLLIVAVLLSAVLGSLLWTSSRAVIRQSHQTVEQGRQTVKRGQRTIEESKKVSDVVAMNIAREYADSPELAKLFNADTDKRNAELLQEQQRLQNDAKALEQQAKYLAVQQKEAWQFLVGGLLVFVVLIALIGIVFTHKIAGPVFKMTGLLNQVGKGMLYVDTGLRKGDELVSFFETFREMVERLRERQQHDATTLEQAIHALERAEVPDDELAKLRELHDEMQKRLQRPKRRGNAQTV